MPTFKLCIGRADRVWVVLMGGAWFAGLVSIALAAAYQV